MHIDATLLNTALGIATIAASVLIGVMFGATKTLRDNNADLKDRVDVLEAERITDKAMIARLQSDLAALSRIVTGEDKLEQLLTVITAHHEQSMVAWSAIQAADTRIGDELEAIIGSVDHIKEVADEVDPRTH